ncbi:MAG: hypothetical protein RLZZ585_1831 [Bacteroidota bacterium]|jgi:hypothetical protein
MVQTVLKKQIVLFILPIIYAFFCIHNTNKSQNAFIKTVDPEYIHLMSSINLANGHVNIQSIESPGTPLYVLGAITTKVTCFVSSSDSLKEDFISNPEKYIYVLRWVLLILTTLSLFILGYVVYKVSQCPSMAILFQLAPFLSLDIMLTSTLFTPDHFLVILMLLYMAVLFNYIHQEKNTDHMKSALYFSLFTAIGCATKITFLPIVILPIFILSNSKQKIVYILSSGLLIPLFAFTATVQYERFISWVKGLIFHSGNYGTGEEKIISSSSFINNLGKIVRTEIPFMIICLLLLMSVFFIIIRKKKNHQNRIIIGLLCTVILHIILVSKHFAIRYLTPSILLGVFGIYLLIMVFSHTKKTQKILMMCFIVLFPLFAFKKIYAINDHHLNYTNSRNSAHAYLEKNLKGLPLLIVPNYFGSATKEYSLWFASKWVGRNAGEYIDDMNKECPDSYFFIPEQNKYFNWRNEISLFDILKSHPILNVYISLDATKRKEEAFGKEILKKINAYNSPNDSIIKINYVFHKKYDMICQLTIDTSRLMKTYHFNDAFCDMERITKDEKYYLTFDNSFLFKNHHLRSSEKFFSGKFSEKLTKENMYGTGCTIDDVKVGDYFEATIWKHSGDDDYLLLCTANNADELYVASNTVIEEKDGWKKIKLSITVDKTIVGNKLNFYSWYAGNRTCYCDDFNIIIGRNKINSK